MTRGIHLIWTTYGTWLPGDDRGHWSPLFDLYGSILDRGGKLNVPDADTRARVLSRMAEAPKRLTQDEVAAVADELAFHVSPPHTPVWAAAIEPNHVHLLVGPVREDISRCAGRLKGRTSSAVGALPQNANRERVWTSGYWKVFLFDDIGVLAVKRYIDDHNLRNGLPAEPFPWIRPVELI
jgi:REP element-mobilizing transposase RayT